MIARSAAHRAALSRAGMGNTNRALTGRARRYDPKSERAYRLALANNVRRARIERSIAMDELAAAIGGNERTIHEIETGSTNPKFTTIVRIAVAMGMSPYELVP